MPFSAISGSNSEPLSLSNLIMSDTSIPIPTPIQHQIIWVTSNILQLPPPSSSFLLTSFQLPSNFLLQLLLQLLFTAPFPPAFQLHCQGSNPLIEPWVECLNHSATQPITIQRSCFYYINFTYTRQKWCWIMLQIQVGLQVQLSLLALAKVIHENCKVPLKNLYFITSAVTILYFSIYTKS